ncbi:Qat anti-phage system TatD family nuclease QatD [Membranihabitans maritimus]|uniref:Qat anti-phage system TatD family nuclease QatD n=1 Tax=Membranihabitans maritimus TaxID=2904244 RepID=UPI001F260DB2|nr:Qat anti-phage system TatD family nuclease QatD [Membranihabitans maritimus]
MRYHDTHFHLDLMSEPEKVANEIERQQVYTIAVTNSPSVFFFTERVTSNKKFIRAALGLHPELAAERHKEIAKFSELIDKTRYIGEIGLDNNNKSPSDYQKQKKVFEKLISVCADKGDKILTIHSRRAVKDVLAILGDEFPGKVILHWYSDPLRHIDVAIDRGYYFSINYPMLQSKNGKKIIDSIPLERILIETDGPFTKNENQEFVPSMVPIILENLFSLKREFKSLDSLKKTIHRNFENLLKTTYNRPFKN